MAYATVSLRGGFDMVGHGWAKASSLLGVVLCCGLVLSQDTQNVYSNVSSDKLEGVLKELDIDYQKAPGKKSDIFSYDFERKGYKVRLYNYGGDDLWIESDFTEKATLEQVNRWNMRAKFSRAVLVKAKEAPTISLESQVDCTLGITEGMIKQFVQRFDGEILAFVKFLKD
jgi:hypothetical protein